MLQSRRDSLIAFPDLSKYSDKMCIATTHLVCLYAFRQKNYLKAIKMKLDLLYL